MGFKGLYFSLIISVFTSLAVAQSVDVNELICSETSADLRKEQFISSYNLDELNTKMRSLIKYSKYVPLMSASSLLKELAIKREDFVTSQTKLSGFLEALAHLSSMSDFALIDKLQEYSTELTFKVEEINLEVADILDPQEKYAKRDELVADFKSILINRYQPDVFSLIDENTNLSLIEKMFLKVNAFGLVPNAPAYEWSEAATSVHDYVWSIFYDSSIFPAPGGKHVNSIYLFETVVNNDKPGLHLNLSFREVMNEEDVELDISFIFSPLENEVPIRICDYKLLNSNGNCQRLSIDEWCDLKSEID